MNNQEYIIKSERKSIRTDISTILTTESESASYREVFLIDELILKLSEARDKGATHCDVDTGTGDYDNYPYIVLTAYMNTMESDEQFAKRISEELEYKKAREDMERAEYLRLKAIFEI